MDAKIKREWYNKVVIEIEENRALFYKGNDEDKIVFSDGSTLDFSRDYIFRIPRLINYVPVDQYKVFLKQVKNINVDVLQKIADIEYVPNDFDKERFLLYMDDGNMVYLTLTKFDMINYYNDVLKQLEDRRGILYLDNGNHFQIKE